MAAYWGKPKNKKKMRLVKTINPLGPTISYLPYLVLNISIFGTIRH